MTRNAAPNDKVLPETGILKWRETLARPFEGLPLLRNSLQVLLPGDVETDIFHVSHQLRHFVVDENVLPDRTPPIYFENRCAHSDLFSQRLAFSARKQQGIDHSRQRSAGVAQAHNVFARRPEAMPGAHRMDRGRVGCTC